jgi:excisionase family DNA binding protein
MDTPSILVSKKDAARLLSISESMLEKMVRRGELEAVRIGKKTLFRRDHIENLTLTPKLRRRAAGTSSALLQ